ncbi:3-hydroxyacyl-CoA dehydrogenase family protein [Gulosibacter molinativorax]|uniref:3-hydroxyacyl-CoA dehydrogenase family protein n=1 Tax=Gulosibacter molinativorax TaxID=256821 RepID=A0ABT7CDB2_9MICO|nr:3-hydroxyacyl-CoA dehydrogenase family protein [Gulosibacter molinativorax]MDJ1372481.1 3-hydroxyacyl-CoA dehydrogenase family protein [Gulosibacter molinativorax]QUY61942.1 3-hydroxybutyryl-CoA dehydrogenase [Gulosibacter molinativorax]
MATELEGSTPAGITPVGELGIVGAGLMGSGIAQVAAIAGISVKIFDTQDGAAERGIEGISRQLDKRVARERMARQEADDAIARITPVTELGHAAAGDAVIEAVIELIDVKQRVFAELAEAARPDAVLATNTSALPITEIAATSSGAKRIIGMHFFSPVPAMGLCEVVRGYRTSDSTVARALGLAQQLGKETILVNRDDAGFVTSRLMTVLVQEATRLVEAGLSTPEEIDRACQLAFGHKMGPFATMDLTGVDVTLRAGNSIFEQSNDPRFAPPQLLKRMVAAGDLGRKTGKGFYGYRNEATS